MMLAHSPLTWIILIPALSLLVILLTPQQKTRFVKGTTLLGASLSLILTLWLSVNYDKGAGGFQFIEHHSWIPALGITYTLGIDGISLPMVLLTSLVSFAGIITMWELKHRVKEFFASLLFLITGVYGVFVSLDLFFFFLFYEIAILPMYLLISIWGSTKKEYAAMKLTLYLFLASTLVLVAFLALANTSGAGFNLLEISKHPFDSQFQTLVFSLLFIGFGALAAVFPLHTWSPDGYAAAPTAASMLHAGVLKKLGVYGIIRVGVILLPEGANNWAFVIAILGIVNIIYGAYCATAQKDLKYMVGYICISHIGIVMLGISTMTVSGINGAIFQMFAHGIMTALFFSSVGFIHDRTQTRIISDLGGVAKQLPLGVTFVVLGALAAIGLPGMAVFNAELLVFIVSLKIYPVLGILAICAIVITAFYVLRSLQYSFFGPEKLQYAGLKDMSLFLSIPRVLLIGTLLFFGFFPNVLLNMMRTTTSSLFTGF